MHKNGNEKNDVNNLFGEDADTKKFDFLRNPKPFAPLGKTTRIPRT
jgi:hypothetical protein